MSVPTSTAITARSLLFFLLLVVGFGVRPALAQNYTIDTYAGNGMQAYGGDGEHATKASINHASAIAVDVPRNVLYIADAVNARIRRVDRVTGIITTVAGTGVEGYNGDNIAAALATLYFPSGVSVDAAGNLFIADSGNNRVRRVDASSGIITTVAGTGTFGSSGDGGPAIMAALSPDHVVVDSTGALYVSDYYFSNIRRIHPGTGVISTFVSGDYGPFALAVDGTDNLYFTSPDTFRVLRAEAGTGTIAVVAGNGSYGYNGDGIAATSASLTFTHGVAVDAGGNVFIGDSRNHRVRRVDAVTGLISTIAGTGNPGYNGDGGISTAAHLNRPAGIALGESGHLYFADVENARIRLLSPLNTSADLDVFANPNGNGPYPAGETFTFLAGVQNMGPEDAQFPAIGFAFDAVLPDLVVTHSNQGNPAPWTCDPPQIAGESTSTTCTATSLNTSQGGAMFTLRATAPPARAGQPIKLIAAATSQSSDPVIENNQASTELLVAHNADLAAVISGPPLLFRTSLSATYRVHVSNASPTDAPRTQLKVTINVPPASVQRATPAGWACSVANSATFVMYCNPTTTEQNLVAYAVGDFDLTILNIGTQRRSRIELEALIVSSTATDPDWGNNNPFASTRVVGVARGF